MAARIDGPLYYERMGRVGPLVAFVHPNPMDQSCWIYQMAHLSTWCRCVAIDIPGYGRSPTADAGLTLEDIADACWEAIDEFAAGDEAVVVGCSVGSYVALHMRRRRPSATRAVVLCGTGWFAPEEKAERISRSGRIDAYIREGVDYRWSYTFADFSPAFRSTALARFFATLFVERNDTSDSDTIVHQLRALSEPDPDDLYDGGCPTLILTGTEDAVHREALLMGERIPGAELRLIPGAGHACQLEQPWLFDEYMLEFLRHHEILDG